MSTSTRRVGVLNDNSFDFTLGTPTPINNAGQTGSVPVLPSPVTLAAATLPTSRSVQVNTAATVFATIRCGGGPAHP